MKGVFVTGSEVQRWGLGVVQEIDSAAMHLWLGGSIRRSTPRSLASASILAARVGAIQELHVRGSKINQGFDDWDLFQVGGMIFF